MYRPPKPLEELALDLVFESFGEDRYNRTAVDYERLSGKGFESERRAFSGQPRASEDEEIRKAAMEGHLLL